jgi:ABC-2 type transport system permease protein
MSASQERLSPARLRKPSLGEAALHGGWTLFVESFKRYLFSKRTLVLSLLFAMPSALILLARTLGRSDVVGGLNWIHEVERAVILTFAPTALLSFAALLNAAGLIQDEIEEQTLTYLLLRPTPRWLIYIAKLAAAMLVTVILACLFHMISYLSLCVGLEHGWEVLSDSMPASMAAIALTATAYSAVFGLIGLLLKRSLVVGVLYIVIFEGILASIPFNFRSYTIVYYFRILCHRWVGVPESFWGLPATSTDIPTATSCITILLSTAAVVAAIGAIYTQRKEFRMKTPAGA